MKPADSAPDPSYPRIDVRYADTTPPSWLFYENIEREHTINLMLLINLLVHLSAESSVVIFKVEVETDRGIFRCR